jgi:predicted transcriptional regulator of viral defense system
VPQTRFDELIALAEEHDGFLTAKQARDAGIADSVLARLTQRGRLERAARGVYRIPHFPSDRFTQYREAVLWAKADDGPENVALSHATAFAVYGISDANPASVHITIPRNARLRRVRPKWVEIHHAELTDDDLTVQEGLPITTVGRTVQDMLASTGQVGMVRQAVSDARREGYIDSAEAQRLKRRVNSYVRGLEASPQTLGRANR